MPTDLTSDQGAGVASSQPTLFGRAAELGQLRSMLGSIRERGQATLVRGDPGIGKTALMVVIASAAERVLADFDYTSRAREQEQTSP